jgi:hypothetical protein
VERSDARDAAQNVGEKEKNWFEGECRYGRQLGLDLLAATGWTTVHRCIRHGKVGICEWNGQTHETQRRTLQNAFFKDDCCCGRQLGLELLVDTKRTCVDRCIRHGKVGICELNGQTREKQRRTLKNA